MSQLTQTAATATAQRGNTDLAHAQAQAMDIDATVRWMALVWGHVVVQLVRAGAESVQMTGCCVSQESIMHRQRRASNLEGGVLFLLLPGDLALAFGEPDPYM